MIIKNKIAAFFSEGHERSLKAKKNIAFSFLLKGLGIIAGLLVVPLTIKYVNPAQYGIWLTLSSVISWISFFDIGLGNGLKNKLTAAVATKNTAHSKVLISTTYAVLFIIAVVLLLLFIVFNNFINWDKVLNTTPGQTNYNHLALIVFSLFCLQFVVQTINTVLTACHYAAKVSLILLASQLGSLLAIFILIKFTASSLTLLVLVNGGLPVITQLIAGIWYYKYSLKELAPGFKYINFDHTRELLSLGGVFFIIQIGALVLFQTDNIVIVQLFGPAKVTTFNIAYKLFSVFTLGFNIIVTPLWSAFTDAYAKHDFLWIRSVITKMRYMWGIVSIGAIVLYFLSPFIYRFWLKSMVTVPPSLSIAMVIYIIAYTWQTIHVYFLNGINKIRLQLYLVIVSSLVNIPLAIFLGHKIGLAGITLSNAVLFIVMGMIFSWQSNRILDNKATGLFNS